tara:strand:+ start:2032 stop:2205 length:174 start_codon:yes stop_codon:yes gene_type:complete
MINECLIGNIVLEKIKKTCHIKMKKNDLLILKKRFYKRRKTVKKYTKLSKMKNNGNY